jgi:peptidyl-prolyl cis-trans isomerase SurA
MMKLPTYFIILLLTCSTPATAAPELIDYIVAVVNDEVIVHSTLEQEIRFIENSWRKQKTELPPHQDLEKQVLENLIMMALQLQLAQHTGIVVEDSALNDTLRNMAAQDQQDLPTFRRTLESDGYNYEQFRESIRKQLIINRLQQRQVVNRISVTAQEIDNFLANQAQPGNTNTEYHLFHILIATPEAASPEDIAAKQQQAKEVLEKLQKGEDFQKTAKAVSKSRTALTGGDLDWLKEGEMPKVFQPVVAQMKVGDIYGPLRDSNGFHLIKLADKRSASEKSIVVTQNKVQHILIKTSDTVSDFDAQSRLEKLKTRLEGGEDFATLARANSEDTSSAANGGLLDWVNPSELVPEFEEVMNNLQPKQLSKPFKSRYGWHLVQVLERRQHDSTEESLRINATNQIRKRKIDEELQIWLRQLRDEAYVEVKTEVAGGR